MQMNNCGLGILDEAGESWFVEQGEIQAVPMSPDRPINETHVAMVADFNTGRKRYQVYVAYNPRSGTGRIRLNVEPSKSAE